VVEETKPNEAPSRRFALLLEYDGWRYAGSQLQSNALTVQSVLEDAIEKTTGERARAAFAGRTDAGVHARGQVASFASTSHLDTTTLQRALNAWLPEDVVVRAAAEVDPTFDPRRQAIRRHYRYLIDNGNIRPALNRKSAWYVPVVLDVDSMAVAAQGMLGCHDFAAFASALERADASTIRHLQAFDIDRRGHQVVIHVIANAFLPHQVRRMVGALVEVGKGKMSSNEYLALLGGRPSSAGPAAPAHALCLMCVEYERNLFGLESEIGVC
jgi:tRNA pseudouridine38-40 synthase